jgi:hypothetical protein
MTSEQAPLRRLLRKADTKKMFGNPPESSFYKLINDGVIPQPARANSGRYSPGLWFEDECLAQERLRKERDERLAERERKRADAQAPGAPASVPAEPTPVPAPAPQTSKAAHKPRRKGSRLEFRPHPRARSPAEVA